MIARYATFGRNNQASLTTPRPVIAYAQRHRYQSQPHHNEQKVAATPYIKAFVCVTVVDENSPSLVER